MVNGGFLILSFISSHAFFKEVSLLFYYRLLEGVKCLYENVVMSVRVRFQLNTCVSVKDDVRFFERCFLL